MAADENPLTIALDGPTRVGIGEKHTYKIIITGGPEGSNTTYSWKGTLGGEHKAEVTLVPGAAGPSKNGTFFSTLPPRRTLVT